MAVPPGFEDVQLQDIREGDTIKFEFNQNLAGVRPMAMQFKRSLEEAGNPEVTITELRFINNNGNLQQKIENGRPVVPMVSFTYRGQNNQEKNGWFLLPDFNINGTGISKFYKRVGDPNAMEIEHGGKKRRKTRKSKKSKRKTRKSRK